MAWLSTSAILLSTPGPTTEITLIAPANPLLNDDSANAFSHSLAQQNWICIHALRSGSLQDLIPFSSSCWFSAPHVGPKKKNEGGHSSGEPSMSYDHNSKTAVYFLTSISCQIISTFFLTISPSLLRSSTTSQRIYKSAGFSNRNLQTDICHIKGEDNFLADILHRLSPHSASKAFKFHTPVIPSLNEGDFYHLAPFSGSSFLVIGGTNVTERQKKREAPFSSVRCCWDISSYYFI
ncbi:unnamed protein product [Lepeophtheirus salmonis]|uniref:(salmon louse) hypothetical protein n=1 Tax=Lepeophtheirus salmonis TaxID=72036 RepID=A0A7R8CTP0_LEPSM|nr:unnamed protein product [Lepeophtheirus salmonis]CAF2875225.1 unnamed protein product [Lepeophtheirus salmonis]